MTSLSLPFPDFLSGCGLFKVDLKKAGQVENEIEDKSGLKTFKNRILCAQCKFPITFEEAEIAIDGKSRYTFFNPHGLVFDITCFQMADGCVTKGQATPEFSWFPGYRWQVAICRRCRCHLGWAFLRDDSSFYGLIGRNLIEGQEEGG